MDPWFPWSAYLLAAGALLGFVLAQTWQRRWEAGPVRGLPFISILILVRNQEEGIEAFLRPLLAGRSVATPPAPDYELVVVDAGSTDDTWAILSRMVHRRPGVRLLRPQSGERTEWLQAGQLFCRSSITLTVDLTVGADLRAVQATLTRLLGGGPRGLHGPGSTPSSRPPADLRPDNDAAGT